MTVLLRRFFWLVMFLISTFCFYVLLEHGYEDFSTNSQTEFQNLKVLYENKVQKKEVKPPAR